MKYAYAKGIYKRTTIYKAGQGQLTPTRIGVALYETQNGQIRGYKVALSLDQIKTRMARKAPAPSTLPLQPRAAK